MTDTDRRTSVLPLLAAGALSGPLFVTVVLAQMLTRPGFDPARHPLSSLALGPSGWIQVAAFVTCGFLAVIGAAGLRHALAPGRAATWGPWLVGAGGVALIVAGVFPADPVGGFPAGAPDTTTWHGAVHAAAPSLSGIAGLAAFVVFARRFAADRRPGWVAWTGVAPLIILACAIVAGASSDFRFLLAGQIVSTAWTASVYLLLIRRELTLRHRPVVAAAPGAGRGATALARQP